MHCDQSYEDDPLLYLLLTSLPFLFLFCVYSIILTLCAVLIYLSELNPDLTSYQQILSEILIEARCPYFTLARARLPAG